MKEKWLGIRKLEVGGYTHIFIWFWTMISNFTPVFTLKVVPEIRWKTEKESKSSFLIQRLDQRSCKIKFASWAKPAKEERWIACSCHPFFTLVSFHSFDLTLLLPLLPIPSLSNHFSHGLFPCLLSIAASHPATLEVFRSTLRGKSW